MKKFPWFWNLVHYNLFVFEKVFNRCLSVIDPFSWLNKISWVKKFDAKKYGIKDMNKLADEIYNYPETGIGSVRAGIHAGGLLVLLEFGIFNFTQVLVGRPLIHYVWDNGYLCRVFFLAALCIPPGVLNYFVLFKNDRYLIYFKEFETESPAEKRRHTWLAVLTILAIWGFCIGSFVFLCCWRVRWIE